MLFPTFTVLSVLATLSSALPGQGNHHGGARPRRAHHFGQQQALAGQDVAAGNTPQPPPGAKVYTTKIENPRAGGNSSLIQLNEGGVVHAGEGVVDLEKRGVPMGKRAFSGMRATYYAIGLGACGQYDSEPAYIVALNSAQYGGGYPGPQCFKSITITGGNRNGHAVATIKDECPTCPYGGLDMSEALFSNFASADDGVATITWWYNDDAPPPPPPPAPTTSSTPAYTPPTTSSEAAWTPPPSTSTTPAYTPPTTSEAPPPSSVYTPPPVTSTSSTWVAPTTSTTSTSSSATSTSSSSSATSSVATSSSASSSAATAATTTGSLALANVSAGASGTGSPSAAARPSSGRSGAMTGEQEQEDPDRYPGNLIALPGTLLQFGNIVVMSAQQAK